MSSVGMEPLRLGLFVETALTFARFEKRPQRGHVTTWQENPAVPMFQRKFLRKVTSNLVFAFM